MDRKKFNLWRSLRKLIIGAVVAAVLSAVLSMTAPDVVSPSCGENAMFAFLLIALSAGMYGIFAMLGLADKDDAETPAGMHEVAAESLHIDQRVKMAANARRYEFLRDVAFNLTLPIKVRDFYGNLLVKDDLDSELDRVMRAFAVGEDVQQ
ncbi:MULTISPECIES: hypothetical protein [Pseudomonas]|uniref:hypothetical protein n=1 Tax=Pseudomonas TaxID=286 RepID=UPI00159F7907|nr:MULTISPECIES: hypothetical protein [Pseudomonas]NVZ88126.1 hypothetical protein [Pseudomonas yamanorum]NWD85722.1 hypothetical protein [Pseudomonas sp. K5002]